MNKIEDYGLKAVMLAEEGKQLLMASVSALHTAKAVVEIAAIQTPINKPAEDKAGRNHAVSRISLHKY
ncbi:MAG: hypothetical protein ACXVLF_11290 [Flavisolibacter sp.]